MTLCSILHWHVAGMGRKHQVSREEGQPEASRETEGTLFTSYGCGGD